MPTLPAVSVIIPNYNRENLIQKAIQSVLDQTFCDFELIVVDDGSSDESCSIVKAFKDPRVKLVCHPSNIGLAAAWNTGIQETQSDLVAFLDSDDTWHHSKLEEQTSFLLEHQNITGCTTGYILNGLYKNAMVIPTRKDLDEKRILFHNTLHLGTTMLIHRGIFDQVGFFDETLMRGQDTDWLIRFSQIGNLQIVPKILSTVNQHTQRSATVLEQARIEMLKKYHKTYQRFGVIFTHRKIAQMWSDVAYQYEREGNRRKMREYSLKSIAYFPFQSPGIYLILIDALIGCNSKKTARSIRQMLSRSQQKD